MFANIPLPGPSNGFRWRGVDEEHFYFSAISDLGRDGLQWIAAPGKCGLGIRLRQMYRHSQSTRFLWESHA